MKFHSLSILGLILIFLVADIFGLGKKSFSKKNHNKKHKQISFITDRSGGFGSDVGVVIRKTPSILAENRLGLPLLEAPQQFNSFGSSNTSNAPNIGGYGRTAEIANPTILFHSKSPVTVIKDIPAHIGNRNEKRTITSMNKETGKVESHLISEKVPIYGDIQSIKTLTVDSIRPYDLQYRRFRKTKNIVHDNPEFQYHRDQKYISE